MRKLVNIEGNFTVAILQIGLVDHIITIIFVTITILLIYSLLMISVEQRTFEFGVMRLTGLSTRGLISLIAIQALLFVVPAIIIAFILAVPALSKIYHITSTSPSV